MTNKVILPEKLKEKVAAFPEYKMGVHKVALILKDGRIIENVLVAWENEIVRVGDKEEVDFISDEIVDILDRS